MSAEITPERIAELRKQYPMVWSCNRDHHPFGHFAYVTLDINEVLDALEFSLAEVKAIRKDTEDAAGELLIEIPEPGSVASKMLMANTMMRRERDKARSEVQRLTEEARRSDAGRVDVPERAAWLTIEEMAGALVLDFCIPFNAARRFARAIAEASKAKASRLSPSPKPATGAALTCDDCDSREGCPMPQAWRPVHVPRQPQRSPAIRRRGGGAETTGSLLRKDFS